MLTLEMARGTLRDESMLTPSVVQIKPKQANEKSAQY
jgi:hypothetical protein